MSSSRKKPPAIAYCEGAPSWNPNTYLADRELHARAEALLRENDLRAAITTSFSLRKTDNYVYHAIVAVTLAGCRSRKVTKSSARVKNCASLA
ncbi:hypothetical protein GGS20DRAFT_324869 [Poronia punctata]|nr:hypothetical protein GGS20DRAFT_324869 [Poronia punctata]